MLLNRNNYETFFLLYADDELRAKERMAVENFVSENEDLRGELNMILAAVLPVDDCSFIQKDSLYKNSFVDGSLQEKLLLKIDNELSAEELYELNKSIIANPSATKEEQLLLATKLDANAIIACPKKGLLFKKETDMVVVFRMVRWAAAAVLIGFGLFFGWSLYNKKALQNNDVAVKPTIKPANNKKAKNITPNEQNIPSNSNTNNSKEDNKETQKTQTTIVAVSKNEQETNSPLQKIVALETKELASNNEIKKIITAADNIKVKTNNDIQTAALTKLEKVEVTALINENIVPLETSYAQASLTDTEVSNNKIMYINEEDVKRSKVGAIFKKLKRMIERTAKIKPSNPIRIAGFQFGAD